MFPCPSIMSSHLLILVLPKNVRTRQESWFSGILCLAHGGPWWPSLQLGPTYSLRCFSKYSQTFSFTFSSAPCEVGQQMPYLTLTSGWSQNWSDYDGPAVLRAVRPLRALPAQHPLLYHRQQVLHSHLASLFWTVLQWLTRTSCGEMRSQQSEFHHNFLFRSLWLWQKACGKAGET